MPSIKDRLKNQTHRLTVLASCAFARTVEHLLTDSRSKDALDVAERFADGFATIEEVRAAYEAAGAASSSAASAAALWAAASALTAATAATAAGVGAALTAARAKAAGVAASEAAAEAHHHLILDCILPKRIYSPFPIHVKGLATTIYEKKDWLLMPILADALEEIGQVDMAKHCRCPIHAKGCWVLDSINWQN